MVTERRKQRGTLRYFLNLDAFLSDEAPNIIMGLLTARCKELSKLGTNTDMNITVTTTDLKLVGKSIIACKPPMIPSM